MASFFTSLTSLLTFLTLIVVINTFAIPSRETNRIVGGAPASKYIARRLANVILLFSDVPTRKVCTATVIGQRWLLLAAHCVMSPNARFTAISNKSYAFIGNLDPYLRRENTDQIPFEIESFYVHRKYFPAKFADYRHDIAMARLKRRIPKFKYVPMKLASSAKQIPSKGAVINAAGYGAVNSDGDKAPQLMRTQLVLKPYHVCKSIEKEYMRPYLQWVSMLCAVSVGFPKIGQTDTCSGDSGGPLYNFNQEMNQIVQFAITSFGTSPCALAGSVAWYTRVDTHYFAIRQNMRGIRWQWKTHF